MRPPVGLLPAAGRGLRFGETGYDKELFPLLFHDAGQVVPRPICTLALNAMAQAGATRCVVAVSPEKLDVIRLLGERYKLALSYIVQKKPAGLSHVVRLAAPWLGEEDVFLSLPDTVFLPQDAPLLLRDLKERTKADVCLGVFPVAEPERLGPVVLHGEQVLEVLDKPGTGGLSPIPQNSWGIALFGPRFTSFCATWDLAMEQQGISERVLGHAFEAARRQGLVLRAHFFDGGSFLDIGTPNGLLQALKALSSQGLIATEQGTAF